MNHTAVKKHPRGETLIEVLVALIAVTISGAAAASLLISSLDLTAFSKDYLVAQNLSAEAVESVRNILDTNELLYPADEADCWNAIAPDPSDTTACGAQMGDGEFYTTKYFPDKRVWQLEEVSNELTDSVVETGGSSEYKLERIEVGTECIYAHPDGETPCTESFQDTTFYRQIEILHVGSGVFDKRVVIVVTVKWLDNGAINNFITTPIQIKKE